MNIDVQAKKLILYYIEYIYREGENERGRERK